MLGQGDDPRPPVAGVRALLEQSRRDERADLTADGGDVVVQRRRELRDAHGPLSRDDEEHGVCRDVHAVLEAGGGVLGRDEELLDAQGVGAGLGKELFGLGPEAAGFLGVFGERQVGVSPMRSGGLYDVYKSRRLLVIV